MPKTGKKKKKGAGGRDAAANHSEEEFDTSDNASVASNLSDAQSLIGGAEAHNDEVDEIAQQEDFEDKLKECIDNLTEKSAQTRKEALKNLIAAMSKKYLESFLLDRKMTITDALEKLLKKGKGEEQALAADLAIRMCLTFGSSVDSEEVYVALKNHFIVIMSDTTAAYKAREKCAIALAVCCFIASGDMLHVMEVMSMLEKDVFRGAYLKGDGMPPSLSPEAAAMHAGAVSAWCLLLSIVPSDRAEEIVDMHLSKQQGLLLNSDVDLKIRAGEAIALLYELARESQEDYEGEDIDDLCECLKELATDSHKYKSKKDRVKQRSSFRDVLRAVEQGDVPAVRIRFGIGEYIDVNSWAKKRQYDMVSQLLGPGLNIHLQENSFIREVFGLGAPICVASAKMSKASKFERHQCNSAAFKARTKARAKHRDKRVANYES